MKKVLVLVGFMIAGCDNLAPQPISLAQQEAYREEACPRGYNFFHKLAPGENYQCPKPYRQDQVWKDVGIGISRAPTDMVECTCRKWYE